MHVIKLKFKVILLILISNLYSLSYASTNSLQSLLTYALNQDPRILSAKADVDIARSQTDISNAGHYPVLSVVNTQVLTQHHKDNANRVKSRPSLKAQVNLFSWGAIQHAVTRDRLKEDYFKYKTLETQEQVGKTIIELYLTALRAKEVINVYEQSLMRHKTILRKINSIVQYDEGRAFEAAEAESRLLQTEAVIEQQQRILQLALSQLNRYASKPMTAQDLVEPFAQENPDKFVAKYRNPELTQNPTFLAQQKELESAQANIKVAKAKRLPAINLEGEAYNKGYNLYLGVSWNILDMTSHYQVDQSQYTEYAAKAKLQEVQLELQEQARSAEIDLKQNHRRLAVVKKQIVAQKKVAKSTALQFDIAQRSLLDVLNAYKELSDIEVEQINIRNDFRVAALNYLISQARITQWAGIQTLNLNF